MTIQMRKLCVGLFACFIVLTTVGCSTVPVQKGELIEPAIFTPERVLAEGVVYAGDIWDPWEGFNRAMYRFNYRFDKYVFLPAVNAYQFITPDPIEKGFHNFFNNIRDITTLVNSILQLNLTKTMNTTTRLMVNTGIGLLGFIDVASDVPRVNEDFGQTLGYWGVPPGPYLVLPFFGPSGVRDGCGLIVDSGFRAFGFFIPFWVGIAMEGVDTLNRVSLIREQIQSERRAALDWYTAVRSFYTQYRENQIQDKRGSAESSQYLPGLGSSGDEP